MEAVEDWTLDGDPAVEEVITKLGNELEEVGNIDLQKEDELIKIGAFLHESRTLRLLQALDTAHPGAASKILMHAEDTSVSTDDIPGLFFRRSE